MSDQLQNPHLNYLKTRPPAHVFGRLTVVLPWLALCLCGSLTALLLNSGVAYGFWQLLAGVGVVSSVIIPALLGSLAASSTANDIVTGYYPLVMLTPLTDRQLARSYFYAVLWRVRGSLWLLVLLVGTIGAGTLWLAIIGNMRQHPFTLILLWTSLLAQLMGWCWAMVALGVVLGLRYQYPAVLSVMMPIVTLTILGTCAAGTATPLLTIDEKISAFGLLQVVFFMVLPFGVLWIGLRIADVNARRIIRSARG